MRVIRLNRNERAGSSIFHRGNDQALPCPLCPLPGDNRTLAFKDQIYVDLIRTALFLDKPAVILEA